MSLKKDNKSPGGRATNTKIPATVKQTGKYTTLPGTLSCHGPGAQRTKGMPSSAKRVNVQSMTQF